MALKPFSSATAHFFVNFIVLPGTSSQFHQERGSHPNEACTCGMETNMFFPSVFTSNENLKNGRIATAVKSFIVVSRMVGKIVEFVFPPNPLQF